MQPISTMVLAALLAVAASAAQAAGLELKTCPGQALHAYPLAPGTRFQSLVVPDLAVANRGAEPAELTSLTFELLDKGVVVDTRRLVGEALTTALKGGASAQLGPLQMFAFQFCDGRLLGDKPKLSASAALPPAAAGPVPPHPFGWKGAARRLRLTPAAPRPAQPLQA